MIWERILIILSRKILHIVSGTVKPISVIGLFTIWKIHCAVEILEEQLTPFWDLVSHKYDSVLFCSAKVYLMKSREVFPVPLWRLMIYSDSLRKLNPLQRIISKHSADVLKHNGCALPPVALVKSCCSEWRLRVRTGLHYSLFVLAEQLRLTFTALLQGIGDPI